MKEEVINKMKIKLCNTDKYIEDVDFFNTNPADLIKEYGLRCSYCNNVLVDMKDTSVLIHNPKELDKPIRLHLFCIKDNCRSKWAVKLKELRDKENE